MEAASRGAAEQDGLVVGILPGFSRRDANRWVTVPIVTGMDQARNVILVRSCDALIAVGGMYGTLSEIALALKLGRPVVGLGTWRLRPPEDRRVPIIRAATPEAAVARAIRAARTTRGSRTWLS
jgi:predicted Rossmann-fold nucleotide-binding protein